MPNGLNPDRFRTCVLPDLGPNCLQRLSSDSKRTNGLAASLYYICLEFCNFRNAASLELCSLRPHLSVLIVSMFLELH